MSEPARMTRARLDRARRRSAEADAAVGVPLQPLDLAAILATPPPAIDWIWGGYVEAGTVCKWQRSRTCPSTAGCSADEPLST